VDFSRLPLLFILLAGLSSPGWAAKSFCCNDEKGSQTCGDILPQECYGRAYREISERGTVLHRIEAPLTAAQKELRDAEAKRKKEEERTAIEERRKNLALLNIYSSEKDLDFMRERALADIDSARRQAQGRHKEALLEKRKLDNEAEFYKKKTLPHELQAQMRSNDIEIQAQQAAMAAKEKELEAVRARFAEDKKRYIELLRKK